ncbi:MAG TPA: sigma 54-interacting transcriptional regulator, partial [Firmicutes bacterium]|nr:sigma 54-interacting transcriptional regulator [Bacillota bacterium]
ELFGYAPGAFTGAKREGKPGLVAAAHRGTLFLDEIGDMPMALQAKMLQVIEEKRYLPIGANKYVTADVRILAATNQDLELLVRQGRFRQDLYYRLNVLTIWIPPLRERPEDILPLLHYYLHKSNEAFGLRRQLTAQTISCLLAYSWPGNVRELRNLMERLVLTARGETIDEEDLPASVRTSIGSARKESPEGVGLRQARDDFEREIIRATYERLKSSRKVARALGISQSTAIRKIRRYAAHGSSPQRALQPSSRKPEGVGTVS